jgi:signal transduction histidine kinase
VKRLAGRALRRLRGRGTIKGLIFLAGILTAIGILGFARVLVEDLRAEARANLAVRVEMYRLLATYSPQELLDFTRTIDFPLVYTDAQGNPKFWKNLEREFDEGDPDDIERLRQIVKRMDAVHEPIAFQYDTLTDYFHYGDSVLIQRVQLFPVFTLLASIFVGLLGYLGFRTIRRSEESGVWVGMARETAHQLGTPISSLMGWIEVLESDPTMGEALEQMKLDTRRLEKIAYRFNKIGSEVELSEQELAPIIEKVVDYFRRRLPRGGRDIRFELALDDGLPPLPLNAFLFEWVIENLVKNSLDSISQSGGTIRIEGRCVRQGQRVQLDVSDTGKGVDPSLSEEIFRPGYSTKSRGWGLGLSLARRIVQEVHGGRIFVHETRPGRGITFRIALRPARRRPVRAERTP